MAVKVRHPGVGHQIERDFQLMMRLARITSLLPGLQDLRLEASLEQFSSPLREQVSCNMRFGRSKACVEGPQNVRVCCCITGLKCAEALVQKYLVSCLLLFMSGICSGCSILVGPLHIIAGFILVEAAA